jgi:ubiquinone/menaquinone biosynthesis C-methylase UbiE
MRRLASWVVEQFYGRLAWAYDAAVWALSGGLWYRWAFTAERFVRDQPVLEVGFGTGHLLAHLGRKGLEVIGVDKSPQMAAIARRRLDRACLRGKIICADAAPLPLPDGSVGTIITTMPAGYAAQEVTWAEFARVLRPGGRWIIVSGPRPDGVRLRLAGLYLLRLFEHGLKAIRGKADVTVEIPSSLFADQRTELTKVGSIPVLVVILDKQ